MRGEGGGRPRACLTPSRSPLRCSGYRPDPDRRIRHSPPNYRAKLSLSLSLLFSVFLSAPAPFLSRFVFGQRIADVKSGEMRFLASRRCPRGCAKPRGGRIILRPLTARTLTTVQNGARVVTLCRDKSKFAASGEGNASNTGS